MAAGNFTFYNNSKLVLLNGTVDPVNDNIVVALLTSSYTPSASHSTWSDVSSNECADEDYAQKTLTSASYSESAGVVTYDAADTSFGDPVSITAKYAVYAKGTTGSLTGTDVIIGYVDLNSGGGSASSTSSVFSVNSPNGLFKAS